MLPENNLNSRGSHRIFTSIQCLTYLNDSRLYWLWMRLFIAAGIHLDWPDFKKMIPALNLIDPVAGTLSWGVYGLRFSLQMMLILQQTSSRACQSPNEHQMTFWNQCREHQWLLINDALWGTSNLLSAIWLSSPEFKPSIGTLGWWGNMNMELLLINDIGLMIWQFNRDRQETYRSIQQLPIELTSEKNKKQLLWKYKQEFFLANIAYDISLACGFFMMKGFFPWANNKALSSVGASLCVIMTAAFNGLSWFIELSRLRALQSSASENTIQAVRCLNLVEKKYQEAGISLLFDYTFPLMVWLSLKADCTALVVLTIVMGLSLISVAHSNLKTEEKDIDEPLRPAACPWDPEILNKATKHCTWLDHFGFRGQAAGRRNLNGQQPPTVQYFSMPSFWRKNISVSTIAVSSSEVLDSDIEHQSQPRFIL